MPQRSGVIVTIVKNFIESLKPRRFEGKIVGKDHFGNIYYQITKDSRQREERWFDPKVKDDFQQEIPAEWESWLRYRRSKPPLESEVLANAALAAQKKVNAAKLEAGRKPQDLQQISPPTQGFESFPTYDEYEISPGEKKKKT